MLCLPQCSKQRTGISIFFFLGGGLHKLNNRHTYANKYDLDYCCIIFCFQFAVDPTWFRNVFCLLMTEHSTRSCLYFVPATSENLRHSRNNINKQHIFSSIQTFICINISGFIGSSNLDLLQEDSRLDRRAASEAVYLYISWTLGYWLQ